MQLGATDEARIIRCIEYCDIARKRYPQHEHCAVLVGLRLLRGKPRRSGGIVGVVELCGKLGDGF